MGEAPDMANMPVGGGPQGMPPPPPPEMPPQGPQGAMPPQDIPLPQSRPMSQAQGSVPLGPSAGAKGKVRPMHQQPNTPQAREPVVLR